MNQFLKIYSRKQLEAYVSKRAGETKLGESVQAVHEFNDLKTTPAKYVIFGIPEDIGVRANSGVAGTSKTWHSFLGSFLNMQANSFLRGNNVVVLGEINCDDEMEQASRLLSSATNYLEKLGQLVRLIDAKVSVVVQKIVSEGKIPIVLGGGHNNSYGNIKGTSQALQRPVNVVNFDVHTDFRALEHRHSGNGFSYAYREGFLEKYYIFGLHKNYTSEAVFDTLEKEKNNIQYTFFEDILIDKKIDFEEALQHAEALICDSGFGVEVDLDAIQNVSSSAMTPSGFSVTEARRFVRYFSKQQQLRYVHFCEGIPLNEGKQMGKLLTYFVSDIIIE